MHTTLPPNFPYIISYLTFHFSVVNVSEKKEEKL